MADERKERSIGMGRGERKGGGSKDGERGERVVERDDERKERRK